MIRSISLIALGALLALPLWMAANGLIFSDLRSDLRDCRAALSAFLEDAR